MRFKRAATSSYPGALSRGGRPRTDDVRFAIAAAGCDVIVKPFDLTVLADALEAVASLGLAAFGAKAGTVTAGSQPVTLTTGDASNAKNLNIRSPSATDVRSPRTMASEELSR
jgi:hypothetical protein